MKDFWEKILSLLKKRLKKGIYRKNFGGYGRDRRYCLCLYKTSEISSFVPVKINDFMEYDLIGGISDGPPNKLTVLRFYWCLFFL